MLKYIVFPGYVLSKNDGDIHYLNAWQLMQLYKVKPGECFIFDSERHNTIAFMKRYAHLKLIELRPLSSGKYLEFLGKEVPSEA